MKYNEIHPIAVFGTLRCIPENQGNHHLMHGYKEYKKGFIPHFEARGISLYYKKNASVPVEVFYYESNWDSVIAKVDALERFDPTEKKHGYYVRTLMNVKLLNDYQESVFQEGLDLQIRSLDIPHETWSNFEDVQAWVYSSSDANRLVSKLPDSPIVYWQAIHG